MDKPAPFSAGWPLALQIVVVAAAIAALTYAAGYFNYRSGLNAIWIIGIPIGIAIWGNRDAGSKTLLAIWLVILAYVTLCLSGEIYGFY